MFHLKKQCRTTTGSGRKRRETPRAGEYVRHMAQVAQPFIERASAKRIEVNFCMINARVIARLSQLKI